MIYLVAKNFSMYTGSAVVAMDVAESLVNSGMKVQPVCLVHNLSEHRADEVSTYTPIKMPPVPMSENYSGKPYGRLKYWTRLFQCRLNTLKFKKKCKPTFSDLIIFNGYEPPTLNIFFLYAGKYKTVQIVHVSPTFIKRYEDTISLDKVVEIYSKSEALVFVSEAIRKQWLSYGALDQDKTHYIPNCAHEGAAKKYLSKSKKSTRDRLGLKQDRFYLISVARLVHGKGQDLLIEAAPELKRIAPNLEILLIGSGHKAYTKNLKDQVRREAMDYVSFLGRKPNAMEYIYASDSLILMSRTEALGLVVLEAMVLMTPVIASDVDGVPEMIEDGETGLLFGRDNIDELTDAFKKIYADAQKREQYAKNASERYWSDFSKEKFTERYVELVRKLSND